MLTKNAEKIGQKRASTISGHGIYGAFTPKKHRKKSGLERIRLFTTKNDQKKISLSLGVVEAAGSSPVTQTISSVHN